METRKWSEDDKRRSKDFITAIEKRLQIRRIYRSLESFVGGRIRDIDYRLINRTTRTVQKADHAFYLLDYKVGKVRYYSPRSSHNRRDLPKDNPLVSVEVHRPHKGVKAFANSDVMYFFTSAQDGDPSQDDVRLRLDDDLKKAQDHNQRQAPHKGVKASANSDVMYFFTSAQDGDPSQDDVRDYTGSCLPSKNKTNRGLLTLNNKKQTIPLYIDALYGKHDMVSHLYDETNSHARTYKDKRRVYMKCVEADLIESLTALFKHIESFEEPIADDNRERTLAFIRDKVFPIKSELLKPQEQMERHITDLIKKSLQDVTERSLGCSGVIKVVSDGDHIDRLILCIYMALPYFLRGASSSKFLNYLNKNIIPVFDQLPEERKVDLLKNLAESSPYSTPQDSRQILPSLVQLLKKYMPVRKTGEEMNFTYVECLLYTFHHLAHKAPNATNSLCGYKIVTGQPSDRLGEDFSEFNKDFTERLSCVEDLAKATMKKLTQGMAQQNKTMATAMSDEEKANIKTQKQNATTGLRTCNNILAMTQPLHAKAPSFIGDKRINLSWKEAVKTIAPSANATGVKRPASTKNGSGSYANKRARGGGNQLVHRAFEGISLGGRGGPRGGGQGRGRGRRGGRGRGYY
ncbi:apoptosis inhibitor 5-like protein API5 isoform X1 [Tanacetum coccineum]